MMALRFDWDALTPWVDLLAQTSLLLGMVLLVGRFLVRGSAARNALYRAGVVGLLLLPALSFGVGGTGLAWRPVSAVRPVVRPAPPVLPALPAFYAPTSLPPVAVPSAASMPASLPAQARQTPRVLNVSRLLWALWAAGAGFMLLRLATGLLTLRVLVHKAIPVDDPQLHESLRRVCAHLHVQPPKLVRSTLYRSPFLAGIHGATIVLPERLPPVDPEKVLAHEAAHLARGDCRWTLLGELARALFFWQPLAWLLARRLTESADLAADNAVLELGGEPGAYASQLAALAGCRFDKGKGATVMGASGFASSLRRRVKGLLAVDKDRSVRLRRSRATALSALALACTLLTACFSLGAKDAPPAPASAAPAATDKTAAPGDAMIAQAALGRRIKSLSLIGENAWQVVTKLRALPEMKGVNIVLVNTEMNGKPFSPLYMMSLSIDVENVTLDQALTLLFAPHGMAHAISNGAVVIGEEGQIARLRAMEAEKASAPDDAAIQALLRQRIPAVALPNVPLLEALEILKAQLPSKAVNLFVDPTVLASADILVKLDVKDVPLSQALDLMLKPHGLDYMVQGNTICVSTIEGIREMSPLQLRVYDVRDFGDRLEFLVNTIVTVSGAEEWSYVSTAGGQVQGSGAASVPDTRCLMMDARGGLMAVNNSERIHRKVAEILQTLRQATPPEKVTPEPAAGRTRGTESGGEGGAPGMAPGGIAAPPPTGNTPQPK